MIAAVLVAGFTTSSSPSSNTRVNAKFASEIGESLSETRIGGPPGIEGITIKNTTADEYRQATQAYPAETLDPAWARTAASTWSGIEAAASRRDQPDHVGLWQNYGPTHKAIEPGVLAFAGATEDFASRTAALQMACVQTRCRIWAGPVGGGVWVNDAPTDADPVWTYVSEELGHNSVGEILLDPTDASLGTLWVGTGEPNSCSSGCAAGAGLYFSSNAMAGPAEISFTKVPGACVSNSTYACVRPGQDSFDGRGISEIIVDPTNPNHMYVASATAARSISHTIGAGGQHRFDEPSNKPGLYESFDRGQTFTPIWIPNPNTTAIGPGRRGVIDAELDPLDPNTIYASAFSMGVWRRCSATAGNTSCAGEVRSSQFDFDQVFAPRAPNAGGSDVERTMFDMVIKNGRTRIYLTTGQTGVAPAANEAPSSFWRTDNANKTSAALLATQPAPGSANPPAGNGIPFPAFYDGWQILTARRVVEPAPRGTHGDWRSPYFPTYNFCTAQCWYDQEVISPNPARPDEVYVLGSYVYAELPCYTRGVGCGSGVSNARGVLWSTTAGDPDRTAGNRTFNDMTFGAMSVPESQCAGIGTCQTSHHAIHPDQHDLLVHPNNPNQFFEASDGGVVRTSGAFANMARTCFHRGIPYSDMLLACQRMLSRVPSDLGTINAGLSNTLQFVGMDVNPSRPCHIIAGTQDNSTWHTPNCDTRVYPKTIYGDGGNPGFDKYPDHSARSTGHPWMFNQFTSGFTAANFRGGDPALWVDIFGPQIASGEPAAFYWPEIADPNPPFFDGRRTHPIFTGHRHVWRSWAWGAGSSITVPQQTEPDLARYESECLEFFFFDLTCGDFQPLGGPAGLNTAGDLGGSTYGSSRAGGVVSHITRRAADTNTMWAATSAGRIFLTRNAHDPNPANVQWFRIDTLPTPGGITTCPPQGSPATPPPAGAVNCSPTRHPNAIYPHPTHPNVAFVAYSGYNAVTPGTPGHVFMVTLTETGGVPSGATFTNLNVEGGAAQFPSANPGDLPVNDVVMNDANGVLFAATDFGVLAGSPGTGEAYNWSHTPGMPRLEISDLAMFPSQQHSCRADVAGACGSQLLYAATHSQGIWLNRLG